MAHTGFRGVTQKFGKMVETWNLEFPHRTDDYPTSAIRGSNHKPRKFWKAFKFNNLLFKINHISAKNYK
jgi:hypothetical protein